MSLVDARFLPLALASSSFCAATPVHASDFTLSGSFTRDDRVQLLDVVVGGTQTIDMRSFGYAGGTTATGVAILRGGFDTILTVFDASEISLAQNDDGADVATDPLAGSASDARLTQNLAAGNYTVALTQYGNFANGPSLSGGFAEDGHPYFTADPTFSTGGASPVISSATSRAALPSAAPVIGRSIL